MSDDTDNDDILDLADPSEFQDAVSQRAVAFCHVARVADAVGDAAVREQCLAMLRKLNASIRTPPAAQLVVIDDGRQNGG
ncbi:MAG: hypothetical protein KGM42_02530 [Hyphomicrobiales bacterium]|nr:hypothetical protein [Hyphomicrobiales bacterium]